MCACITLLIYINIVCYLLCRCMMYSTMPVLRSPLGPVICGRNWGLVTIQDNPNLASLRSLLLKFDTLSFTAWATVILKYFLFRIICAWVWPTPYALTSCLLLLPSLFFNRSTFCLSESSFHFFVAIFKDYVFVIVLRVH